MTCVLNRWRELRHKDCFSSKKSKLLVALLRLSFRLSLDLSLDLCLRIVSLNFLHHLLIYYIPFCRHTDCNQFKVLPTPNLSCLVNAFVISSYSEAGIWARCLAGLKAGRLTILWRAKLQKHFNEFSPCGDASETSCVCSTHIQPTRFLESLHFTAFYIFEVYLFILRERSMS